jgi:hypothetical protein
MVRTRTTPTIAVNIGQQGKLYHALVTTAPAELDGPSTMTLYAAPFSEVAGFAADPIGVDSARASVPARLVLVDASELTWHRSRCRESQHILAPADPVLIGLRTLQHWLWQRLRSPL